MAIHFLKKHWLIIIYRNLDKPLKPIVNLFLILAIHLEGWNVGIME